MHVTEGLQVGELGDVVTGLARACFGQAPPRGGGAALLRGAGSGAM
jgi:hypothetical protein